MKVVAVIVFIFFSTITAQAQRLGVEYCKIFGRMYVVQDKNLADFKVYHEETESFANLVVYQQQQNKFFADRSGQWYFTNNKMEADFWIYFEEIKGLADFTISYTDTESFAGCKQ